LLLPFPSRFVSCTIAVVFSLSLALSFGPHFNTWTVDVRRIRTWIESWIGTWIGTWMVARRWGNRRRRERSIQTRRPGDTTGMPSRVATVVCLPRPHPALSPSPPDEPDPVKQGVSAIAAKHPPPCPSSSSPILSVFPAQPRVALSVWCRRIPAGGVRRSGLLQARSFAALGKLCSFRCFVRCIIYFAGKQKKL
jgi:hypothetical protein